jgi:hypothetical protein
MQRGADIPVVRVLHPAHIDPSSSHRDVRIDRGRDEDLIEPLAELSDPVPADVIELAEHVVEQEHRSVTDLTEQRRRPDLARERDGPCLALRGGGPSRQSAQGDHELVAVRSDEGEAASALLDAGDRERVNCPRTKNKALRAETSITVDTASLGSTRLLADKCL